MIFYYSILDSTTIEIHIRMEADDGTIGESIQELHPGEAFLDVTFEQFIADGTGEMEINHEHHRQA